jgi:hypothetical protein
LEGYPSTARACRVGIASQSQCNNGIGGGCRGRPFPMRGYGVDSVQVQVQVPRSCLIQMSSSILNPGRLFSLPARADWGEEERCCVSRIEFARPCERPLALGPLWRTLSAEGRRTGQSHAPGPGQQRMEAEQRGSGAGGRGRGRNDVEGTVSWTSPSLPSPPPPLPLPSARKPWRPNTTLLLQIDLPLFREGFHQTLSRSQPCATCWGVKDVQQNHSGRHGKGN